MNFTSLELEQQQHVATLWLNRPDVRNAFDEHSIAELTQAFRVLEKDQSVRVIVLAARGSAFSAGADLHWMKRVAGYTEEENRADARALAEMLHVIYQSSKATIARVQGDCYAGGNGLVAACDIAIAAESVTFCLTEVRLGLIPATIGPYVIRAMGERAAHRYFLTAERFDAQEAYRLGYVHQVVAADALDEAVSHMTHHLLAGSPHAIDECKRLIRDIAQQPIDQQLMDETARRIGEVRVSPDGREGIASFLEKRKPNWLTR
ncbi:MAG: enoyl-CoA hydratase/isomerase family protein [Burkholderiaceae bacterium]